MADHVRCYFVVDVGAPRLPDNWAILVQGAKDKPLSAAILAAAQSTTYSHNLIHFNRPSVPDVQGRYQWRLGDFEIDKSQVDDLLIVLNERAAAYEITGTNRAKFAGVMLEELREVAIEAGYAALAPLIGFEVIGFGARETAIDQAIAWLSVHITDWE